MVSEGVGFNQQDLLADNLVDPWGQYDLGVIDDGVQLRYLPASHFSCVSGSVVAVTVSESGVFHSVEPRHGIFCDCVIFGLLR